MKKIPLTQGKFALVDDEDFEVLIKFNWYETHQGYAKSKYGLMHRILMCPSGKEETDHINHNRLDNQRSNLRVCSLTENRRNSSIKSNNKTGYKGVWFDKSRSKFTSQILFEGKKIYLGRFKTKEEAALVYNEAAKKYYKEFAYINNVSLC